MASSKQLFLASLASSVVSVSVVCLLKHLYSKCKRVSVNKRNTSGTKQEPSKIYEAKSLLDQYMIFHFGTNDETFLLKDLNENAVITNCAEFPKKVAALCQTHCLDLFTSNGTKLSALDIGCAVGASSFELTKYFDYVLGIDYSVNFVNFCKTVQEQNGTLTYESPLEGDLTQKLRINLDSNVNMSNVAFEVGDACNLRDDIGQFDLVLASNLVCRLVEPMKFFDRLKKLVKPNGYVILSTPFTWSTDYTPKENWIGGYIDENGTEVNGNENLKNILQDTFEFRVGLNLPMVIRETRRKFSYVVCYVSIWKRK